MSKLALWVIDHRDTDHQPEGDTVKVWQVHDDEPPGPRYADYCALYGVWGAFTDEPPPFVGFFGYRKYLWHSQGYTFLPNEISPAHAPGFWQCNRAAFDRYRSRLAESDGSAWLPLLSEYDILQGAPFAVEDMIEDFSRTRSLRDAECFGNAINWKYIDKIYPYLFITRWEVFDRMMREMEPLRRQLDPLIKAADSTDEAYKKRPMAYVMERVYSYWLAKSGLRTKELPLLHCWEVS